MGHLLSHPITSKYVNSCGDRWYRCGAAEMQGFRAQMEDTHNVILTLREWREKRARQAHIIPMTEEEGEGAEGGEEPAVDTQQALSLSTYSSPSCTDSVGVSDVAFFAVYDGHSGGAASIYACVDLPSRISQLSDPFDHAAVTQAVLECDAAFCKNIQVRSHGTTACFAIVQPILNSNKLRSNSNSNINSNYTLLEEERKTPGPDPHNNSTTAATSSSASSSSSSSTSLLRYRVLIGNVGDSRCVIIGVDGRIRYVTNDHKPDNDIEAQRIRLAGGNVSFGRVDGELAMSRSLGDYTYKAQSHLQHKQQKVIATPDLHEMECYQGEKILVMCDGLVERCSNEQIVQFIEDQMRVDQQQQSGSVSVSYQPHLIAQQLLDYSLEKGSKDNMSCMLILLENGTDYTREDVYVPGSMKEGEDDRKFVETYLAYANRYGIDANKCIQLANAKKADNQRSNNSNSHILTNSHNDSSSNTSINSHSQASKPSKTIHLTP